MPLDKKVKIPIKAILENLDEYRPKRKGWTWRRSLPKCTGVGYFSYDQISESIKNSVPLPAAHYFNGIDPQPDCVITSEIASGRFEDDIRRMRMAAWHGADHIMVIRTLGQSHIDGLIEGTPEGIGGIPITRKQLRASRKALDLIEEEVGRPINFHSYVSGIAGPEIAVLFAEEGVNGAHQDPQYNVLYRGINPIRSFVDAAVAKKIMASSEMLQIDGAHNANASAKRAWKVMPELLVQHAINCAYSVKVGMKKESIALSTVPPVSAPAPEFKMNFIYALTLRELFKGYKFRAQMNTRYIESDLMDATRIHVLDTLVSRLTSADVQSTITPDEGRNVPWHVNSVKGVETAKHTLIALDGIKDLLKVDYDQARPEIRELKMRAILFMEEMLEVGGYFEAAEDAFFVDNGCYPERSGDGIARPKNGGIGAHTVIPRDPDYMAPVCDHFGINALPDGLEKPCELIDGCTFHNADKIQFIDEFDETDCVSKRLDPVLEDRSANALQPEVEWAGDAWIQLDMTIPDNEEYAEAAAIEIARRLNLEEPSVLSKTVLHPSEGVYIELKARVPFKLDRDTLQLPEKPHLVEEDEIFDFFEKNPLNVVAGTVGNDEHSVGIREILDVKHGGIEKYGVKYAYLGTSVQPEKFIDAAIETNARVILISTIVTHNDVHVANMKKIHELAIEKGVREGLLLIAGGTQITSDLAVSAGMDAGFGRGTQGIHVASYLVRTLGRRNT